MAAAEIAETYPDKKVTLVQSNKELVPGYSARLSQQILNILQNLKVEVTLQLAARLKKLLTHVLGSWHLT